MKSEYRKLSAGEYSLMETDEKNVFLFFRKDGRPITDDLERIGHLALGFYMKFLEFENKSFEKQSVQISVSCDCKFLKLTILEDNSTEERVLH